MWADPDVVRHIGGVPSSRERSWGRILTYRGLWALLGYGYWLVEERETGRFAGEVGFADFHREVEPSLGGAPELGWAFAREVHGKGYATEAAQAALRWAQTQFAGGTQIVSLIAPENAASVRVAEKCGLRFWQEGRHHGDRLLLFRRPLHAPGPASSLWKS